LVKVPLERRGLYPFERNGTGMNNKHTSMMERKQEMMRQRREAGSVSTRFPEVSSIIMNMTYSHKGARSILRTFHFTPDSDAFFVVNCLRQDCVDGGFDLTEVITAMIKNRSMDTKGSLSCKGREPYVGHSDIVYEVAIQYA
jgi:hypothetical protein